MMLPFGVYRVKIYNSIASWSQYRVGMLIYTLGEMVEPIIYLSVWSAVATARGGEVDGFTPSDFAAYYIIATIVRHFTQIWHMYQYEGHIREGRLSMRLLRPVHPIHEDIGANVAYKIMMLAALVPTVIILALVFHPTFNTPLWAALAFIPVLLLAGILAFLSGWALAMAAFWTTRIGAVNQTYFTMMFFFSGQLAPLELLPPTFQTLSDWLPFRWMLSFPVELLRGQLNFSDAAGGILAQILWIIAALLAVRVLWLQGVKRYTAVGG